MSITDLSRYENRHSGGSKLRRLLWELVWTCLARPTPRWCLNGWRCGLLRLFGATVGKGCRVQGGAEIWQPWQLTLGDNCWVSSGVKLYAVDKIVVGDNCVFSTGAFLCTASHDLASPTFELTTAPIVVGDSVWVAANALVLPGCSLADGAVVAAGAVVSRPVSAFTIVAGNPARPIGSRSTCTAQA